MQPCAPRNIMDEILYGKEDDASVSSLATTSQLFYLFGEPTDSETREKKRRPAAPAKKKVTHYLSPATREELDKLREHLLLLFPGIGKNTFSRSNIVDKTLESVIKGFHLGHNRQELLQLLLSDRQGEPGPEPLPSLAPTTAYREIIVMIVACPVCRKQHHVDRDSIPALARKVRCSACSATFPLEDLTDKKATRGQQTENNIGRHQ